MTSWELGAVACGRAPVAPGRTPRGRHISLLEDRMVKNFLPVAVGAPVGCRVICQSRRSGHQFRRIAEAYAGADELARNSRARSARLRGAVRTTAPAFPEDESLLPAGARSSQTAAIGGRP